MTLNLIEPDTCYRPSPFWSWNDKLDESELRWQVQQMHKAGLGGFFMHARGGLKTAYLSKEWLSCIKACLDEAKKLGMNAWLYDENGWPSGFGGGIVNGLGVKYQQKYLVGKWIKTQDFVPGKEIIAIYSQKDLTLLPNHIIPTDYSQDMIYQMSYDINPFYVDNLDKRVVAKFIEVTHDFYYKNLPKNLLSALRGIFTDEPQLSRRGCLWSFILEDEYTKAYQTNLLNDLPHLLLDTSKSNLIRNRFWKLITRLFSENFLKQIQEQCKKYNWQLTGHHVLEERFSNQIPSNGAVMAQYQYYDIPGMDILGRFAPDTVAMKQLESTANQTGKKQILTESFACTGWNFNFYGMKWHYQIQLAHGINYLCQHLHAYSLKGMRKRDYPGSWGTYMPQWEDYKVMNDRFSRIGMLISNGKISNNVLVMHPISSAWKLYHGNDNDMYLNLYYDSLNMLSTYLDGEHASYHYADEQLVEQFGSFEDGKIKIGEMSYSLLVIPQATNFSRKMFQLMKAYKADSPKNKIIVIRNQIEPNHLTIDGMELTPEELKFYHSLTFTDNELSCAKMAAKNSAALSITENNESAMQILSLIRDFDSKRMYYFANNRYNHPCDIKIILDRVGSLKRFNIDTGKSEEYTSAFLNDDGKIELRHHFSGAGDLLLFVDTAEKFSLDSFQEEKIPTVAIKSIPSQNWLLSDTPENILTLERCKFKIDNGDWEFNDVIVIQSKLLKLQKPCHLQMEFSFLCDNAFDTNTKLRLAAEDLENTEFCFNGHKIKKTDIGYKFDKAFRIIELGNAKIGKNTITLTMDFHQSEKVYAALERAKQFETEANKLVYDMEVESLYLLGNFHVNTDQCLTTLATRKNCTNLNVAAGTGMATDAKRMSDNFVVSNKKDSIDISEIVQNGYPFFAGHLSCSKKINLKADEIKRAKFLTFQVDGINTVELKINHQEVGKVFFPPFQFNIENDLTEGENTLEFTFTMSLRNMLGPFHLAQGESGTISTLSFNKEKDILNRVPPDYDPLYCFVNMGIKNIQITS